MIEPSLPPMLLVALEPSWDDAHRMIIGLMRDRGVVLPLKMAIAACAAGVKSTAADVSSHWSMRRVLASNVHEFLADGLEIELSNAWWLLCLDPHDDENRGRAHCALVHLSVLIGPRVDVDPTIRGWGLLAAGAIRIDDHDPFACAHRLACDGSPVPVARPSEPNSKDLVRVAALAYFAAAKPTLREAKDFVFDAVVDVIEAEGRDVQALLSDLEAIRSLQNADSFARETKEFSKRFEVYAQGASIFSQRHLSEVKRALSILSVHSSDTAAVRIAAMRIASAAEQAVKLGLASRHAAQIVACAWGMISRFQHAIGEPPHGPEDTDYFALAHRNAVALRINFFAAYADDSPDEPDDEAHDDQPDGADERVVVLPEVGGVTTTNGGREAAAALKSIAGVALDRIRTPDIEAVRASLRAEFPHFVLQIETVLADLTGTKFVKFRPTLLLGQPGVGKSRFARRLASVLGVALHRYDGAGASDNAFAGTPRRWSTGEPSAALEAVRWSGIANPIVLVDELDKAGPSSHNGSLATSLLPFLDRETASRYPDAYALTTCDLSHVCYLATANDEHVIPPALRDRLRLLRLPDPSPEHLPALVRSLVADIAEERGTDIRWFPHFETGELEVVASLWPGGSMRKLRAFVECMLRYRETFVRH